MTASGEFCVTDDSLARVVDEQLVTRRMILPQHALLAGEPAAVLITEHAVLPAVRMRGFVLFPQQQTRDTAAPELAVQVGKVRPWRARQRHRAPVQPRVQYRLVDLDRQRPAQPGLASTADALLHRRAGAADRGSDLSVAEAVGLEPQHLTDLAHG